MERHGFAVDPENCNVTHVRKGKQVEDVAKSKRDEAALVDNSINTCSKAVLAMALDNLDEPSIRCQPPQGNKPVRLACLDVPNVDPTVAIGRAAEH